MFKMFKSDSECVFIVFDVCVCVCVCECVQCVWSCQPGSFGTSGSQVHETWEQDHNDHTKDSCQTKSF